MLHFKDRCYNAISEDKCYNKQTFENKNMKPLQKFYADSRSINYFLFVNTKSGSKSGLKHTELSSKILKYLFESGLVATVQTFDLFDSPKIALAIEKIKKLTHESSARNARDVRLVICGGDGTIPWVISLVKNAQINFSRIIFGIVPIGTGNDFSRSLGWGYQTTEFDTKNFEELNELILQWNCSKVGFYDIWDIEIEVFEQGCFYEIKNQKELKAEGKKMKKSFTNYFGIGLEPRIVYTVQKKRASNAFLNKVRYAFVGAKNLFTKKESLSEAIEKFIQIYSDSDNQSFTSSSNEEQMSDPRGREREIRINKQLTGLVCLNCPSYMAGLRSVWQTQKLGNQGFEVLNSKQEYDDGNLQFIAFDNELSLALERIMRSGYRVGQGKGPFRICFRRDRESEDTFIQIDGESLKIRHLKQIRIFKSQDYSNGQIKVMVRKTD